MFEVEYFIRPNDTMVCPTGISYSDSFFDEFVEKQDILDGFIIFADLYHIVDDCTSDLVGLPGGDDTEFWQANKVFLAYLNSIYFYREFAKNTNLPLSEVIDTYYAREEGMFRFICDFRNSVIHQSVVIRDRFVRSGDLLIPRDTMILSVRRNISKLKKQKKTPSRDQHITSAESFLNRINTLSYPIIIRYKNNSYFSLKQLAQNARHELGKLNQEALNRAYASIVKPTLEWFLAKTQRINDHYKYTFIVNKGWHNDPAKADDSELEPALVIEAFVDMLVRCLGKDNTICQQTYQWLREEGYTFDLGTEYDIPRLFSEAEKN